jgi:hypothetical protein
MGCYGARKVQRSKGALTQGRDRRWVCRPAARCGQLAVRPLVLDKGRPIEMNLTFVPQTKSLVIFLVSTWIRPCVSIERSNLRFPMVAWACRAFAARQKKVD